MNISCNERIENFKVFDSDGNEIKWTTKPIEISIDDIDNNLKLEDLKWKDLPSASFELEYLTIYDYLANLWLDILETYKNFRRSESILRFGNQRKFKK